jgi:hypothetical protein
MHASAQAPFSSDTVYVFDGVASRRASHALRKDQNVLATWDDGAMFSGDHHQNTV